MEHVQKKNFPFSTASDIIVMPAFEDCGKFHGKQNIIEQKRLIYKDS